MSTIGQNLSALGFAAVIAVVDREQARPERVRRHFQVEPASQFASASLAAAREAGEDDPQPEPARVYPNLGIVYGTVDRGGYSALKADPAVTRVNLAPQLSPIRPVDAPVATALEVDHTWGLTAMGVPQLWGLGLTGSGVKVAHLDTGVDASHPALEKAVTMFAEFGMDGREIAGAEPRDSDPRSHHGTHTAATVAGRPVDNRHVGVAPGCEVLSALVIEGGDVIARILGGMDWAVGNEVRILSMSLGIRGVVNDFLGVLDALLDNRVLPVIAVGNEGPGTSRSPGNYPQSLSVGAHDKAFAVADFSSSQRLNRRTQPLVPDIVGPGVDVISAGPRGGWQSLSGTSMATPHVAGLAALLFEAEPAATPAQVERAIFRSAQRGDMEQERVNRGAVHGVRALDALRRQRIGAARG
ncbi:subtilase family protein [Pseudonocardia hierapolitana]|uniref:Subtilase family protein n=1 Tax=Pseudonocardia hierapolitana TaxID=1128676 RepID=A0A561T0M2_9PSEU|nr:S8 family serine peptidase [Pseudonocardia hierapolitana]TWF80651.1 subtilase family protein [Pseudonocardia hierapolitana]